VAFVVQSISVMRIALGQIMTLAIAGNRRPSPRVTNALIFAGALLLAPVMLSSAASAQILGYASAPQSAFPSDNMMLTPTEPALTDDGDGAAGVLPERLRRTTVSFDTREAPGTIIIDTGNTALYFVLGQGRAIRYGVGVGREGFTWSGVQTISRKAEWPDWHPPAQMIARQPYLPRFMAGGPGNPLGARAMYLGSSDYRIHGTNDPSTIGKFVSSGCIRLTNEDVADLFSRVDVGTRVVVLPKNAPHLEARATATTGVTINVRPTPVQSRPAVTPQHPGRQAMNLSASSLY
jgi:lipoprotein-anchoring transpeptidase ErfK/SrfK